MNYEQIEIELEMVEAEIYRFESRGMSVPPSLTRRANSLNATLSRVERRQARSSKQSASNRQLEA